MEVILFEVGKEYINKNNGVRVKVEKRTDHFITFEKDGDTSRSKTSYIREGDKIIETAEWNDWTPIQAVDVYDEEQLSIKKFDRFEEYEHTGKTFIVERRTEKTIWYYCERRGFLEQRRKIQKDAKGNEFFYHDDFRTIHAKENVK